MVKLCCPSCQSGSKAGALDLTPLCSILTFVWLMAIPFLICMLPDVGMVKYVSNLTWSWRMLTWVARISWYTPPCSYTFPPVGFSTQLLDRGHHSYISTGLGEKHFYSLCFCPFKQCQPHIMRIKSLFLETHEPHACKLSLQVYKY